MAGATAMHALLLVALMACSSAAPAAVSSVASTTSMYLPDARLAEGKPFMPQLRHKCSQKMLLTCGASGRRMTPIICVLRVRMNIQASWCVRCCRRQVNGAGPVRL
jgi:hypothetical protein